MNNVSSDYTLSWQPAANKSKIILRCERDKQLIFSDETNIQIEKQRKEIADKLVALNCDRLTVEPDLLAIAGEVAKPDCRNLSTNSEATCASLESMDSEAVAEAEDVLSRCPSILELVYEDAQAVGVVGEHATVLTLYLAGVSRLLSKPMSVIVQGSSSSGKSFVVESVAELFPDESKLIAQQMTPNSLYYLPEIHYGIGLSLLANDQEFRMTKGLKQRERCVKC